MDRLFLVFQILTPVILLYFMGYSFGTFIGNIHGVPYPVYFASGMIVFNAIFTSQWLGHGIWDERRNGMFTQLRCMGFSEIQYVGSALLYNLFFAIFSMIVIFVAYPELLLYTSSAVSFSLIIIALIIMVAFFGTISMIISLTVKSQGTFVLINTAIFEIFAFTSSALYPPSQDIIPFTSLNPLSYVVDLVRHGVFGFETSNMALPLGLMICLIVLMTGLTVKIIRNTPE